MREKGACRTKGQDRCSHLIFISRGGLEILTFLILCFMRAMAPNYFTCV